MTNWQLKCIYDRFNIKPIYSSREQARERHKDYIKTENGVLIKNECSIVAHNKQIFKILRNQSDNHLPKLDEEEKRILKNEYLYKIQFKQLKADYDNVKNYQEDVLENNFDS